MADLSEPDGSEDPESVPYLEIADQKGNPLKIPHHEKKVWILQTLLFLKFCSLDFLSTPGSSVFHLAAQLCFMIIIPV